MEGSEEKKKKGPAMTETLKKEKKFHGAEDEASEKEGYPRRVPKGREEAYR